MRKMGDVVATVGQRNTADGPIKVRSRVGELFRDDGSGRMSLRLDTVPCSPAWSGWFSIEPAGRDDAGSAP
jgi:hypothetical protein